MTEDYRVFSIICRILVLVGIFLVPNSAHGQGLIGDLLRSVGNVQLHALDETLRAVKELDTATADFEELEQAATGPDTALDRSELLQIVARIETAQAILEQVEEQNRQSEQTLAAVAAAADELESERDQLAKDKETLQQEKSEIETRERLFSMGFFAFLSTTILAVIGISLRFPTMKLERKLKMLEIKEKEMALAAGKSDE